MNFQKIENTVTFDDLVGLDNYRQWIEALVSAIKKTDHLSPRGVFLSGMPGTGKASCVMATASLIDRPVLRYHPDDSNPASIITELGDNPVLLWIDEPDTSCIELLRCLALQPAIRDKVFIIASSSMPHTLPAPLVNNTQFDRVFHIDLPDLQGRAFLWDKLIERLGGDPTSYDNVRLAQVSALFSPGEIEAVVRISCVDEQSSEKELLAHIVRRTPSAALQDEKVAAVRHWARSTSETV